MADVSEENTASIFRIEYAVQRGGQGGAYQISARLQVQTHSVCHLLSSWYTVDRYITFLRNVGLLPTDYKALHPRRQTCTAYARGISEPYRSLKTVMSSFLKFRKVPACVRACALIGARTHKTVRQEEVFISSRTGNPFVAALFITGVITESRVNGTRD
jgi:hypothetical protein